jgi:alkylation response protein AidB-like acyl-CoA dehydrogenase
MRFNGMRMLTSMLKQGALGPEASIGKLFWTTWHRRFGETAMDVIGADALLVDTAGADIYELDDLHQIFMASRAETIYAGSSEIQHNIIGERVLGLPREPR